MFDVTSANATVAISVEELFSTTLQNFSADSAWTSDTVQSAETRMGVDGIMVAGYTPQIKTLTINLEPSSPSLSFLQLLRQAQEANLKPYRVQVVVSIPSVKKRFTFSEGVLQSFKDLADGNTILGTTQWVFHFEGLAVEGL